MNTSKTFFISFACAVALWLGFLLLKPASSLAQGKQQGRQAIMIRYQITYDRYNGQYTPEKGAEVMWTSPNQPDIPAGMDFGAALALLKSRGFTIKVLPVWGALLCEQE